MSIRIDDAVSDAIGIILMIAVATAAMGIIAAFLLGSIQVEKIPQNDLTIIKSSTNTIKILNQRGEGLEYNSTVIYFNQIPLDKKSIFWIKKYGDSTRKEWGDTSSKNYSFFGVGDILESDITTGVQNISIIYNLSHGQQVLESVEF